MTEKQQKIVDVALELFAHQGYASTSTQKIARQAKVSEGLIFRHFTNKEGLLEAIVRQGMSELEKLAPDILSEKNPKMVLARVIELPLMLTQRQPTFWRLQTSLKYQQPDIAEKYDESDLILRLKALAEGAFRKMGYANPRAETRLLLVIVNGLMAELAGEDLIDQRALIDFVKSKYEL